MERRERHRRSDQTFNSGTTCPGHQGGKYRSNLILNHRYITYIESTGAAEAGIVKIKAPAEWQPSAKDPVDLYNPSNMSFTYEMLWRLKSITNFPPPSIPNPLEQHIKPTPMQGAFQSTSQTTPELSIENFARLATSQR